MRRRSTAPSISRAVDALRQIDDVAGARTLRRPSSRPDERRSRTHGAAEHVFRWASVTKLATALATLVAVEEGVLDLDEPAGPEGSTVRHLLAHAIRPRRSSAGAADRAARASGGSTRTQGFELLAGHVAARAEMPFGGYLARGRLRAARAGRASCAGRRPGTRTARSTTLLRLGRELSRRRSSPPRRSPRRRRSHFPGLDGVLPGFGRMTRTTGVSASSSRREVAALDRHAQLSAHVRPLRRLGRHLPLGRPGAGARARVPHRPRRSATGPSTAWPALSDAVLSAGSRAAAG